MSLSYKKGKFKSSGPHNKGKQGGADYVSDNVDITKQLETGGFRGSLDSVGATGHTINEQTYNMRTRSWVNTGRRIRHRTATKGIGRPAVTESSGSKLRS
tara:strand:+ start:752 stop:1051 length:300 start_codon:yes stop_codon:yes gene_type:complete